MTTMQTPSEEHPQFDAICSQVGDWETLPSVVAEPTDQEHATDDGEPTAPLDGLILAGLVLPF
jgi:hypothetical protein